MTEGQPWDRTAFVAGDHIYTWDDVRLDAVGRGTWDELHRRTAAGIAAQRGTAAGGLAPPGERIKEAEAAFRYKRRLLAGEEMEAWLASRALTVSGWRQWIRGEVARDEWPELADPSGATDDDVAKAIWTAGWCSGLLERFARDFAARVAAHLELADGGEEMDLDASYDFLRTRACSEEALRECVAANHLDWVTLECDAISFASDDAAREGLACLVHDGLRLEELATAAGASVSLRRVVVGDEVETMRQQLLSAREGDYLGPLPNGSGFAVIAVRRKLLPSVTDESLRRRAERSVASRAVERAIEKRIDWASPQ